VPIFMVERRFADDLEASAEVADRINRINEEEGVRWLYSFLSADKRKTYCLYEAPFADAIRRAASRAGLPADAVVELGDRLLPTGALAGSVTDGYRAAAG
jgi:predicted HAD superfamily phosphohydrolase YqeG